HSSTISAHILHEGLAAASAFFITPVPCASVSQAVTSGQADTPVRLASMQPLRCGQKPRHGSPDTACLSNAQGIPHYTHIDRPTLKPTIGCLLCLGSRPGSGCWSVSMPPSRTLRI